MDAVRGEMSGEGNSRRGAAPPAQRLTVAQLLVVGLGGALGAAARGALTLALPDRGWVLTTLGVNVTGCVLLAALTEYGEHRQLNQLLRLGLGTGFCGAFTTFSSIMLLFVQLPAWRYAGYLLLSVVLCLAAVRGTVLLMRRFLRVDAAS